MKNILFILGTRPEAVKLAPMILKFKSDSHFKVKVCNTGQHNEMLNQVLDFFQIVPDYDLKLMSHNQSLVKFIARALLELDEIFNDFKADVVVVQGDTSTVLAGSLVSFLKNVKVAHVEAGLRSHDKKNPMPEEINRVLTTHIADFHFAPTPQAVLNLKKEGVEQEVHLVGNTVVDALFMGLNEVKKKENEYLNYFSSINFSNKIILVTCHRRESFGQPFEEICEALLQIANENQDIEIVFPVHLNPNINTIARSRLMAKNIKLIEPLQYPHLIWILSKSYLVLSDSGGIQEEAPSLGVPVLVLRNVTERTEGIEAGTAKLVGSSKQKIVENTTRLITNKDEYLQMARAINPYGDGKSTNRILEILKGME